MTGIAGVSSSRRQPNRAGRAGRPVWARGAWLLLAGFGLAGVALFALSHPFGWLIGALIGGGLLVAMAAHRHAWLVLVPGLAPVIDLATWSGAIHFTESDALVLAALALAAAREGWRRVPPERGGVWRFDMAPMLLLGLMLTSYLLSTAWRPLLNVWSEPALLVGYATPLNGARLAKGLLWALLLLPLLGAAFRREPETTGRALAAGLILGLALVSLAAWWERIAFPGWSNFSSDYRTTALFWEANVGGAMLDGWLALTVPFLLWALFAARRRLVLAGLLVVLALVAYAVFTTFSRGLYLGVALGAGLTLFLLARRATRGGFDRLAAVGWGAYLLVLGFLMTDLFQSGGYRGIGAAFGLAFAVFALGPSVAALPGRVLAGAAALALVAALASVAAMQGMSKGVYLAYAASLIVLIAATRPGNGGMRPRGRGLIAAAGLFWLAVNAVLVTLHWSETGIDGLLSAAATVLLLLAPLGLIVAHPSLRWRADARAAVVALLALGALLAAILVTHTYYASQRFETVTEDLEGRQRHWALAAGLPGDGLERWLGIGAGRFAERYFWDVPDGMYPGSHQVREEDGNRHLRLGGPRHQLSSGELYRVSHRVAPTAPPPFALTLRARAPDGDARLRVEICRKHLLYPGGCAGAELRVPATGDWVDLSAALNRSGFVQADGWPPKLTTFSVASLAKGRRIDVDDIVLRDATGASRLANGDFESWGDRWFFSSDRHHLPWHAKNLWLHYYVEQGALGLLAFGLLGLVALHRVTLGRAAGHALAPALAGALLGFFVVGLFDSLVDAPRVALLSFLLIGAALGLRPARRPARVQSGDHSGTS